MNIIVFLLIGLIAGCVASLLVEGRGLGAIGDTFIGIVGAFVGGFIFDLFGVALYGFWGNVIVSVVGAMAFLYIAGFFAPHRLAKNRKD